MKNNSPITNPMICNITLTIPQILPACVSPCPDVSILPAAISLQVIAAHNPGDNAADEAANDAEYSKYQDEGATMRTERLLRGVLGFYWCYGNLCFLCHEILL